MSDLKKSAVARAINTLASAGAIYTVEFEGETLSNAPVTETKTRGGYKRSGIKFGPMYQSAIDHLESVGDYYELPCPPDVDIEKLRSAMSATLYNKFGAGKTATSVNKEKNVIEVLKV